MADEDEKIFDDPDESYESEIIPNAFSPMRFATLQRKVRDLHSDFTNRELDPRPSFQRGYVWDKGRASRLIESILLNVPLPLIYSAEEADGREVVIDGQQRLLSVFGFISGKFPKEQSRFRLTGLKLLRDLNGKTFDELPEEVRRSIQQYLFQIIRISKESHADVKFEIFERLNSGSVTLNAQELRNCVYRGRFNEVLRKLADNAVFQKLIGGLGQNSRMQDVELVLRFLAFLERTYLNYSGSMKSFLNEFMNDFRDISDEKAAYFEQMFKQAVDLSWTVFGDNAFRKFSVGTAASPGGSWENQVNRPLFDIVMWSFTRLDKGLVVQNSDAIRAALIDLTTADNLFLDAITSAVGDKQKTAFRFELWIDTVREIVGSRNADRLFSGETKRVLFQRSPACSICGQIIHSVDDCHVDHIVPFSKGGSTSIENAQLTHRYCNLRKGARQA